MKVAAFCAVCFWHGPERASGRMAGQDLREHNKTAAHLFKMEVRA